jgi:hypothetical protein
VEQVHTDFLIVPREEDQVLLLNLSHIRFVDQVVQGHCRFWFSESKNLPARESMTRRAVSLANAAGGQHKGDSDPAGWALGETFRRLQHGVLQALRRGLDLLRAKPEALLKRT